MRRRALIPLRYLTCHPAGAAHHRPPQHARLLSGFRFSVRFLELALVVHPHRALRATVLQCKVVELLDLWLGDSRDAWRSLDEWWRAAGARDVGAD